MSGPPSQIANYSLTPMPVSPRRGTGYDHVSDAGDVDMNDSLTPVTQPGLSSLDYGELSDGEILKHIRLLQQILDKRSTKKSSSRNLRTDFESESATNFLTDAWIPTTRVLNPSPPEGDASSSSSTNSLVRTVLSGSETLSNRKRQASSPNRISVEAMVHSLPSGAPNQIITSCGAQPFSPKRQRTATVDLADLNRIEHAYASQVEQGSRDPPRPTDSSSYRLPSSGGTISNNGSDISGGKAKIPPIVLRDKSIWFGVSNEINRKGFSFTKAQNVADGIRLFPTSEADFRGIAKFFTTDNIPFHTYQLPSEKVLNVVLRNIPVEIPDDQIKKQLEELGFKPDSVVRMRRNHGGRPMPLVLVKISKDQRRIYHLEKFMSLDTSVETLKAKPSIGQCFRCQRFGHAQSRCTAQRKCVACGEDHAAKDCQRPKSEPPTCANCGEKHPANYRGCIRFPKPRVVSASARTPSKQKATPKSSQVVEGRSYSQAAAAITWTESQQQLKSNTPVTKNKAPSRTPRSALKKVQNPAPTNISAMLDVLQAMSQQINMLTNILMTTLPSETSRHASS